MSHNMEEMMPKILFIKSGQQENPVTKVLEKNILDSKVLINSKTLKYMGLELLPIGEATHMVDFAGPDYVLIEVTESEAYELCLEKSGFYLIQDLRPFDVN